MNAPVRRSRFKRFEVLLFVIPLLLAGGAYFKIRSDKAAEKEARRQVSLPGRGGHMSSFSIRGLDFSPDGKRLATGDLKGTFKWWNVGTGALIKKLDIGMARKVWMGRPSLQFGGGMTDFNPPVGFSPDGKVFAATVLNSLLLFDGQSGKLNKVIEGPQTQLKDLAFTPDSQIVASGSAPDWPYGKSYSEKAGIYLWNARTGKLVTTLQSQPKVPLVEALDISADGQWLVALCGARRVGTRQSLIQLWDLKKRKVQWEVKPKVAWGEIKFSPDGSQIGLGGAVPTFYKTSNGAVVGDLQPIKNMTVSSFAFVEGGKMVLGGGDVRPLCLWDLSSGEFCYPDLSNAKAFGAFSGPFVFSRDGKRAAYVDDKDKVQVWDVSQLKGDVGDAVGPLTKPRLLWKVNPVSGSPAF